MSSAGSTQPVTMNAGTFCTVVAMATKTVLRHERAVNRPAEHMQISVTNGTLWWQDTLQTYRLFLDGFSGKSRRCLAPQLSSRRWTLHSIISGLLLWWLSEASVLMLLVFSPTCSTDEPMCRTYVAHMGMLSFSHCIFHM